MTASGRLFIKVHNGFPEHPKTGGLSDRAFRNLIDAWCYCSRNLTDGLITTAQGSRLFSKKSSAELIATGWMVEHPAGYEMTGYLEHQMSAAQVSDLQEKRREAGKRGGYAKANRVASAKAKGKQAPGKPVPDIDVDIDKEQPTTELPSSAAPTERLRYAEEFARFWQAYPRKVGKQAAERAWEKATRRGLASQIADGAERMAADPNLPEAEFIPHPSKWLNDGRWADGPFPQRGQSQVRPSTSNARVSEAAAAGQRLMDSMHGQQLTGTRQLEIDA